MLILPYILICICITDAKVEVIDIGIGTVLRGDVGLFFYVTLHNVADATYKISVKMIKCCEIFQSTDMDCDLMKLIGGDMGYLYPQQIKNISLIYPNMYPHNRKGKCLICITYITENNMTIETKEQIIFNTFLRPDVSNLTALKEYYKKSEYRACQTIDQDPLEKCEPVNCQMKYLGFRNYFNVKWQRCQKVPVCISDDRKCLPDVAYIPLSNTCMDLENVLASKDIKYLEEADVDNSLDNIPSAFPTANLRCHHGVFDNRTGMCKCKDGWMSSFYDKEPYLPELGIYHMCNIKISTWNQIYGTKLKMTVFVILVFGALITMSILLLAFSCHLIYRCIEYSKSSSDSGSSSSTTKTTRTFSCPSHKLSSTCRSPFTRSSKSSRNGSKCHSSCTDNCADQSVT